MPTIRTASFWIAALVLPGGHDRVDDVRAHVAHRGQPERDRAQKIADHGPEKQVHHARERSAAAIRPASGLLGWEDESFYASGGQGNDVPAPSKLVWCLHSKPARAKSFNCLRRPTDSLPLSGGELERG